MGNHIHLIHWKKEEAEEQAALLVQVGYTVTAGQPSGRKFLSEMAARAPDAVLIDLTRLPSQGRDLGVLIRRQAATRNVPLVFVGGEVKKVDRVRAVLPDAFFTSWDDILPILEDVITRPTQNPVVPDSAFAAYAGKPLSEKLGVKEGMTVGLIDPPDHFEQTLGQTPPNVKLKHAAEGEYDLTIWFVRSLKDMEMKLNVISSSLGNTPLWIAWPKKASDVQTDLAQQAVRDAGLSSGLVDYKVCSIDSTWSGLLFRRRKENKQS